MHALSITLRSLARASLWGIVLFSSTSLAADPAPKSGDDSLLDGLEKELIDGLPDASALRPDPVKGVGDKPLPDGTKPKAKPLRGDRDLGETDGEDIGAKSSDDPLDSIAKRMKVAERQLGEGGSQGKARALQDGIVADLDKLIDEIRRRQKQSQQDQSQSQASTRSQVKPSKNQPQVGSERDNDKPVKDSTERLGKNRQVTEIDVGNVKEQLKNLWGHLPEHTREQMIQWSADQFLPEYDEELRQYFLRLAEPNSNSP